MRKLSPSEVRCLAEEPAGVRKGPEAPGSKACTLSPGYDGAFSNTGLFRIEGQKYHK